MRPVPAKSPSIASASSVWPSMKSSRLLLVNTPSPIETRFSPKARTVPVLVKRLDASAPPKLIAPSLNRTRPALFTTSSRVAEIGAERATDVPGAAGGIVEHVVARVQRQRPVDPAAVVDGVDGIAADHRERVTIRAAHANHAGAGVVERAAPVQRLHQHGCRDTAGIRAGGDRTRVVDGHGAIRAGEHAVGMARRLGVNVTCAGVAGDRAAVLGLRHDAVSAIVTGGIDGPAVADVAVAQHGIASHADRRAVVELARTCLEFAAVTLPSPL